jgi:hypothetical protein
MTSRSTEKRAGEDEIKLRLKTNWVNLTPETELRPPPRKEDRALFRFCRNPVGRNSPTMLQSAYHDVVPLHLSLLLSKFFAFHLETEKKRDRLVKQAETCNVSKLLCYLPVVLGLDKIELFLDPLACLCNPQLHLCGVDALKRGEIAL